MIIEQIAVLLYGALAIIAALVTAGIADSAAGAALAFAAAGLIYIFQVAQLVADDSRLLIPLWVLCVVTPVASVVVSLIGA